jgi:HEAT repeat protein
MRQPHYDLFLDRLDPTWREDQLAFFRITAAIGPDALNDLAIRINRVSCSAALKQLTFEFSYYYHWPEWVPVLDRLLKHENDLGLFETGVRALGRIRAPQSLAALRGLSQSRATPGFREIVAQVLQETDPAEAFQHHLSRLLKGSGQPEEANEGAHQLAKLLTENSLEPLKACLSSPDPLIFRHALRLFCQISSGEAAVYLHGLFKSSHLDILDNREVRGLLVNFRSLPRPEVQEKTIQILSARWRECQPEALTELASGQSDRIRAAAETIQGSATGILDPFLLETLLSALPEKPAQLAKFLTQAGEDAQLRTRRFDFAMDTVAQGLVSMAEQGLIKGEGLLPDFALSLRENTGNAGVARALARLVPAEAQELHDLLLSQQEGSLRSAALEILGSRRDPAFRTALFKMRRDAISEIADQSLWYLGHLPDAEGTARAFLGNPDPEEVKVGLRFITMHHLQALIPDLLNLAVIESREAVFIATLGTLGSLGSQEAVEPLLALLHSGQTPRIQEALGEALRDMGHLEGAFALCSKATEMNSTMLHTLAVEALARTHSDPERPLPTSGSDPLLRAVRAGWSDHHPWPFRRRIADALLTLQADDPGVWSQTTDLIRATLSEKRNPGAVASEDLSHLNTCVRAFARKVSA